MTIFSYETRPLYLAVATLETDGLIHCGQCPETLPAGSWKLMHRHIEDCHISYWEKPRKVAR